MNDEVGDKGEDAFRDKCNKWGCEFLFISQEPGFDMSEKIRKSDEKRPDFVLTVPYIGPILVDVKTTKKSDRAGRDRTNSFRVILGEHDKLKRLEKEMNMRIWYAFFERKEDWSLVDDTVYFIPLARVDGYLNLTDAAASRARGYVYVPLNCMNKCTVELQLHNLCAPCSRRAQCFPVGLQ